MQPKIGALTIKGFRAFRHLQIKGFGRVNLLTGSNNTGKSSVLEALRILAADGSPAVLQSILRYREEDFDETSERQLSSEDAFLFSTLFNGFPDELGYGFLVLKCNFTQSSILRLAYGNY